MNLRRRVAHGLFWSILSTWTGMVSGFVILVALGRLLGPESFGLIAMAMIVIAFGDLFVVDSGFGEAIIQRKELSDDHCDAAFWLLLGSSVIAMAVFMVIAPLAAASFDQPLVADLVRALSLTLPLGALSAVPSALLSREFRFRALAVRRFISSTGGGIAAVGMALADWGVWSLVGFHLIQKALAVVIAWTAHRWRPRFSFSLARASELWSFSMAMFGMRALQFAETAMMRGLLGLFFGPVVLGFFFMARRITRLMHDLLTAPTSRVALPTFAKVQADRERAKRLLRSGMRMLSLIAVPAYAGVIVLAPVALPLVLGDKWLPAVPYLQLLALAGLIRPVMTVQFAALRGLGMPGWSLGFELANAAVLAALLVGASPYGPLVMAAMVGLRPYLMLPLRAFILHRTLGFSMIRELGDALPIYGAALVMGAAVFGWQRLALDELPSWLVLLGAVAIGGAAYLGMMAIMARDLLRQVMDLAFALRTSLRRSPST
jgi:O-antigen/teichoic acid export membrane protein